MRLVIRALGFTVIDVDLSDGDNDESDDAGSITSYPVSFTGSYGDARWDQGADYGAGEPLRTGPMVDVELVVYGSDSTRAELAA